MKKGVKPNYDGTLPTKPEDEGHTYEFIGWDKEVTAVTSDDTYTAKFNQILKKFFLVVVP